MELNAGKYVERFAFLFLFRHLRVGLGGRLSPVYTVHLDAAAKPEVVGLCELVDLIYQVDTALCHRLEVAALKIREAVLGQLDLLLLGPHALGRRRLVSYDGDLVSGCLLDRLELIQSRSERQKVIQYDQKDETERE